MFAFCASVRTFLNLFISHLFSKRKRQQNDFLASDALWLDVRWYRSDPLSSNITISIDDIVECSHVIHLTSCISGCTSNVMTVSQNFQVRIVEHRHRYRVVHILVFS